MDSLRDNELFSIIERVKIKETADEAFSLLLERYSPLLKRRVSDYFAFSDDKAEAMQEATVALHSAALTYEQSKYEVITFGLYASICISNRLKSLLRKKAREADKSEFVSDADRISSGVDLESYIVTKDVCERVMKQARALLSDYEYDVFRMSFERYTTRDIASALGKTQKSVDNAKFRISKRLRTDSDICDILSEFK